jgi:hypothetical protein
MNMKNVNTTLKGLLPAAMVIALTGVSGVRAEISLNPETRHTSIPFRSGRKSGFWGIIPLIYNRGRDKVRVINFGRLAWFCRTTEKSGRQTFPIIFDGRCPGGLKGGMMLVFGSPDQARQQEAVRERSRD